MPDLDGPAPPRPVHEVRLGRQTFAVHAISQAAPGKGQDAYLVRDGIAAVADGATPVDGSDGRAVRAFADGVLRGLAARWHAPSAEMFRYAIRSASAPYMKHGQAVPSCTAAVARAVGRELVVDVLGDATAVVVLDGVAVLLHDDRLAPLDEAVAARIARALRDGQSFDQARSAVSQVLRDNRNLLNQPGGYWAVSADPAAADHTVSARFPLEKVEAVLLCTDGFSRVLDTFAIASSPHRLIDLARTRGLPALLADLRRMERVPSSMVDFPRVSVEDDATGVLLTVRGPAAQPSRSAGHDQIAS